MRCAVRNKHEALIKKICING